jgi:DNA-binding NarL/FixJ family response regulator
MRADRHEALRDFLPTGRATGAPLVFDTTRSRYSTATARMRLLRLTPRERVVLARAAAGETNTVIAQALFVGPGTVRKHLEHIYDKLEVRTRTEAAAIYTKERVIMENPGLDH